MPIIKKKFRNPVRNNVTNVFGLRTLIKGKTKSMWGIKLKR